MNKIRVLVIEDSVLMRRMISDLLKDDSQFEIVGFAKNGEQGVRQVKLLKPHVITLDIEMPIMNGLDALKLIMKENPTPVIMLSGTTGEGKEDTLKAIEYGAFDFIQKPSGAISLDLYKVERELKEKLIQASQTNVLQLLPKNHNSVEVLSQASHLDKQSSNKIIAIGTSTGGPKALKAILPLFPKSINVPIVIVQHMPVGFTEALADRLNQLSQITVKEVENGETLQKGVAYIAKGGFHFLIEERGSELVARLDRQDRNTLYCPSVDVMFQSLSLLDISTICVILTGMGKDGANGLVSLKSNNSTVCIAESEESAVVYGMPKTAVQTGLVDKVTHLENIAESIMEYCT